MNSTLKNTSSLLLLFALNACAYANDGTSENKQEPAPHELKAKGYGDFLFIPPDSMAIRNFIDNDDDGIDDRYQLQPGTKAYSIGYFYKK